jgi:hypothetical protein
MIAEECTMPCSTDRRQEIARQLCYNLLRHSQASIASVEFDLIGPSVYPSVSQSRRPAKFANGFLLRRVTAMCWDVFLILYTFWFDGQKSVKSVTVQWLPGILCKLKFLEDQSTLSSRWDKSDVTCSTDNWLWSPAGCHVVIWRTLRTRDEICLSSMHVVLFYVLTIMSKLDSSAEEELLRHHTSTAGNLSGKSHLKDFVHRKTALIYLLCFIPDKHTSQRWDLPCFVSGLIH